MKTLTTLTDTRSNWVAEHHPVHEPLPARRRGKRRRPLEARSNWDPWLPLQEAYPEVPVALQVVAVLLLTLFAFFALFFLLAQLGT